MVTFMYNFIRYEYFGQTRKDNFVFWVKIAQFIIETRRKRI